MKVEVEFMAHLERGHPLWRKDDERDNVYPVIVSEDDLPLTKVELRRLRITPAKLQQVFAEAREAVRDIKPGHTARIVADEDRSGGFVVARGVERAVQ